MSWIPADTELDETVEVLTIAEATKKHPLFAMAYVMKFWFWCHKHLTTPETGLTVKTCNNLLGLRGFAQAMVAVGWLAESENGLLIATGESLRAIAKSVKNREAEYELKRPKTGTERSRESRARKKAELNHATQDATLNATKNAASCNDNATKNAACNDKDKDIYKKSVVGSDTVVVGECDDLERSTASTPPPVCKVGGWSYEEFCTRVGGAHPASAKVRLMPKEAAEAAREAFETWSVDEGVVLLLTAFYKADFSKLPKGTTFYRPMGLGGFYKNLGDVIAHAEAWAKWKGWRPKNSSATRAEAERLKPVEAEEQTPEQQAEMMAQWDLLTRESGIQRLGDFSKESGNDSETK